ncbi:prepilin peptidase [Butyrivibrio sp. VCB2006]|uniref:prepilin peptidase n=1 Tax=Butyrivibrio sp. VCB2006 TaxID=1280679 RepID=UPI0004255506|nr:prepilin peptidase [Butyrivibrio sp. VCB2006]
MWMITRIVFMVLLLSAAFTDLKRKEIPMLLIVLQALTAVVAMVSVIVQGNMWPYGLLSLIPGVVMIVISFATRGELGVGDGLILLCMGPVYGMETTCLGLFISLLLSCLFSIGILVLGKGNRKTRLPFVPFLTMGMGVIVLCGSFRVI